MSRRHGFTLLEILIAIALGLLLMLVAVPSVSGMFREQKLRGTFQKFDDFVRFAQNKAVTERRTFVMIWDEAGIELVPLDPNLAAAPPQPEPATPLFPEPAADPEAAPDNVFIFPEGGTWALERPAALVKKPIWEWPFWRSGSCEPVRVIYDGEAGSWTAEYSGLTGRGKVVAMEVK